MSQWPGDFRPGTLHIVPINGGLYVIVLSEPFTDPDGLVRVTTLITGNGYVDGPGGYMIGDLNMSYWKDYVDNWERV